MSAPTLALDLDARLDRMLDDVLTSALAPAGGPADPGAAVLVAGAFEMLHTAFLVHDDLIDGDTLRRGEPNLAETMRRGAIAVGSTPGRAERWALASAVLAGDLALAQAHRMFAAADVAPQVRVALVDLLDETLLVSAGGELADTAYGLGLAEPSLDEARHVSEAKTSMYSFRAPLRAGAILAGAPADVVTRLDEAGRLLGRAFQLVDDLLGVFGPERVTGKSSLSDLREGKRTPLLVHARATPEWAEVARHVGRPDLDHPTARRLRHVLARSSAADRVVDAVVADLAAVSGLAADDALGPDVVAVLGSVAGQIAASLADVRRWVEEAACDAA